MWNDLNTLGHTGSMYERIDTDAQLRATATRLFEQVLRSGGGRFRLLGRRKPPQLRALMELETQFTEQHSIGLQTVLLERIVGSENRTSEFDGLFIPQAAHLQSRWVSIAMAQFKGTPLPPVDLIQVGDEYYVRDGHHRISVACVFDQVTIMATVTVWR